MRHFRLLVLVTISALSLMHLEAKAQTVLDANFITVPTQTTGIYNATSLVTVSDTSTIAEVEIKIGTANGLSDVVNFAYVFDQTNGLPTGFTYSRNGNKLTLGMNTVQAYGPYFAQIRLKDSGNNWTTAYEFITN